jgi:hypothetical protein
MNTMFGFAAEATVVMPHRIAAITQKQSRMQVSSWMLSWAKEPVAYFLFFGSVVTLLAGIGLSKPL